MNGSDCLQVRIRFTLPYSSAVSEGQYRELFFLPIPSCLQRWFRNLNFLVFCRKFASSRMQVSRSVPPSFPPTHTRVGGWRRRWWQAGSACPLAAPPVWATIFPLPTVTLTSWYICPNLFSGCGSHVAAAAQPHCRPSPPTGPSRSMRQNFLGVFS